MQVFIIKKGDKPIYVGLNTDITPQEYNKIAQEVIKNQTEEQKEKDKLYERIANLEKAVKDLKHEIAVDRGEEI